MKTAVFGYGVRTLAAISQPSRLIPPPSRLIPPPCRLIPPPCRLIPPPSRLIPPPSRRYVARTTGKRMNSAHI